MSHRDLNAEIKKAKKAEKVGSYFSAAILYKNALELAYKLQKSKLIKLCKTKVVEMNKKSIKSGKDFKEFESTYEPTKRQQKILKNFIIGFLKIKDKDQVLRIIGQHPCFVPKIEEVENLANNSMPISHQLAALTTISEQGHNLRGGSIGDYSWFIEMYRLTQAQIMTLYLNKLMYILINKNPYGNTMTITDLSKYFSKSKLFSPSQLEIVLVGLHKYYKKDYISAIHILVPQFESFLLSIVKKFDVNIVALDTTIDIATRTAILSEKLLESEDFIKVFGRDFCRQIKFILFEPMGYRLRHKIAHGEITAEECNFQNTTLIIYLYLVLLARVTIKKSIKAT